MGIRTFVVRGGIAMLSSALVTVCLLTSKPPPTALSQVQFEEMLRSNWITKAQVTYYRASPDLQKARGMFRKPGSAAEEPFVAKLRLTGSFEEQVLADPRIESAVRGSQWHFWKR
jgi:hypothetical protein